ncbi:MAG: S-layer homology domain-containing protein [Chroococcales cyanobacterium]
MEFFKSSTFQKAKQAFSWVSLGIFSGVIPLSLSSPAKAQTYPDIQGHWAQGCIQELTQRGIVTGYPDGTFQPGGVITRAEYAAMMNQAFPNIEVERGNPNFTDVSPSYWGYNAIERAYQTGFLSGYPNNEFRPNNLIVRDEAFVALVSGLDTPIPNQPEQLLNATYQDAAEIPEYAEAKIAAATQQGFLISPPKPQFEQRLMGPNDPATRAQIAAAICEVKAISGVPNEYVVNPEMNSPGNGNGIVLSQTCRNPEFGYVVDYPANWQTNSGERGQYFYPCEIFDSGQIEVEPQTEDFDEAIYFDLENIAFDELTNPNRDRTSRVISRRETTVDGRQAVVMETEATGMGLLPEGRRSYHYLIDFGDSTLIARTYNVPNQPYQQNQQVLDQMMNTINFTESTTNQ